MNRKGFKEEQIIGISNESEQTGVSREVCRLHNILDQTFYRWRTKFGGVDVSNTKHLEELEHQNRERDLTETAVRRCVKQAEIYSGKVSSGALTTAEREELTPLSKQVWTLEVARESLKNATAFFAKESR